MKRKPRIERYPVGLCQCGCGNPTTRAKRRKRHRETGEITVEKGEYHEWLVGHQAYIPVEDRYEVLPNGCWRWTGVVNEQGYGYYLHRTTSDGLPRKHQAAHRYVYEQLVGPIPAGLQLDHACHNPKNCQGGPTCPHRLCVNPAHLEPVTSKENARRARRCECGECDRCKAREWRAAWSAKQKIERESDGEQASNG